jgi:hypothetical protein
MINTSFDRDLTAIIWVTHEDSITGSTLWAEPIGAMEEVGRIGACYTGRFVKATAFGTYGMCDSMAFQIELGQSSLYGLWNL